MCIKNNHACLHVKGGILFFKYKDHTHIGLRQAIEIVSARMQLQKGVSYPILCDIRGIKVIDKDARRYLAKEGSLYSKAVALIVDTPVSESISNLFLKTNNPSVPTKIFKNEEEGLQFLESYKEHE